MGSLKIDTNPIPRFHDNHQTMSIRRILFVMFMLTNCMNILASRASRREMRRAEEATTLLLYQFIKNNCQYIQNKYNIENNTCPTIAILNEHPDIEFYNDLCDIHYVPKSDTPSLFTSVIIIFCAFGAIACNPFCRTIKFPTPMYEKP